MKKPLRIRLNAIIWSLNQNHSQKLKPVFFITNRYLRVLSDKI